MKKFIAIALVVGIYLNWDDIGRFVSGEPDFVPVTDGVILYATDWCGYCQKTRELFAEHEIPYVEYDIEKSQQGYQEYKELNGSGIPVVYANGTVIHGYSAQRILAAAKAR